MQKKSHKARLPATVHEARKTPLCKKKVAIGVRFYDNGGLDCPGGTVDRYTVVYTGRYRRYMGGHQMYVGMDGNPFYPQGFGQHGTSNKSIDVPAYSHLGKRIDFSDLAQNCQLLVMPDCQERAEGGNNV